MLDQVSGDQPHGHAPRLWGIVYAGNFVGAFGTAVFVFLSGQFLEGGGSVAAVAVGLADAKVDLSFDRALFLGMLCNVLVCLAVWLSVGARTTSDKILAVLFPVSAFVAAGFEHSVANMYLIPLGLFIKTWGLATLPSGLSATIPDLGSLTWANFAWSLACHPGNPYRRGGLGRRGLLVRLFALARARLTQLPGMRQRLQNTPVFALDAVVLDTETTGLDCAHGAHR